MGEVTSAVIATSLVLIAVFVPVSFFPGTTGILYRQFSLTIAFSIAISAFNALTLSPALSALFLRGEEERPHQLDFLHIRFISRAFAAFVHGTDASISWMSRTYARSIHFVLRIRYLLLSRLRRDHPSSTQIPSQTGPPGSCCRILILPELSRSWVSASPEQPLTRG